jgi:hypothetical protein
MAIPSAHHRRSPICAFARRRIGALVVVTIAVAGTALPAHAQMGGAGFVPSLVPYTVRQAPLLQAGYADWGGTGGPLGRLDAWFGRVGVAGGAGRAGDVTPASVAAMLEVRPQGVGLTEPGVQLQAGYAVSDAADASHWSVPVTFGVFLHAPVPLPDRVHVLLHPSLSVRHVVAGAADVDGTSFGLGLRAVFTDGVGAATLWGVQGHVRLGASGADRGPRWEAGINRVLRRSVPRGG